MIIKLALLINADPGIKFKKFKLFNEQERSLDDLISHEDQLAKNEDLVSTFNVFFDLFLGKLNVDKKSLWRLYCQFQINAFTITDMFKEKIGVGIYIESSIFDHSCQPNASQSLNGIIMEIRAIKEIRNDPICINYCFLDVSKEKRQSKLLEDYFFQCKCKRCLTEEPDIYKKLDVSRKVMSDSMKHGRWKDAYLICTQALPLYEQVYNGFHSAMTLEMLVLLTIRTNLDGEVVVEKPSDELKNNLYLSGGSKYLISKLEEAFKVTHGVNHPLYHEYLKMVSNIVNKKVILVKHVEKL